MTRVVRGHLRHFLGHHPVLPRLRLVEFSLVIKSHRPQLHQQVALPAQVDDLVLERPSDTRLNRSGNTRNGLAGNGKGSVRPSQRSGTGIASKREKRFKSDAHSPGARAAVSDAHDATDTKQAGQQGDGCRLRCPETPPGA